MVNPNGTTSDAALRSRIGPVVVGAVGYGLGNGLRLEIEGDYRNNRFSEGRSFGYPAAAGGTDETKKMTKPGAGKRALNAMSTFTYGG